MIMSNTLPDLLNNHFNGRIDSHNATKPINNNMPDITYTANTAENDIKQIKAITPITYFLFINNDFSAF